LKDEFLATLSHELRTPLNAILGWTSMLARGQVEASRLPRVFEALDRNAQSQAQLIADVLDVSRIVTGKLQLQPAIVDLCDVVERAADVVRPAAAAKNVRVAVAERSDCLVKGDPDRLQQVFWNLLSNAVKFTPGGGSVRVEIARENGSIAVAVIDSGVGIPEAFVPFVFDRFRQADQSTTRVHGGLGLGLSIVKHLTELHGGTVAASSDGPGRGARFEVRLPASNASAAVSPPQRTAGEGIDLAGRSILVVDDDESTREVIAAVLEAAHAQVHVAASAAEARQRLQQLAPALIIADLGMPGEDGFSFMRDMRQNGGSTVPAIALSAYADRGSQEAALQAGFNAFQAKPTRAHALLEVIGTLLNDVQYC
jgi:CheY-like chemotaxis protein